MTATNKNNYRAALGKSLNAGNYNQSSFNNFGNMVLSNKTFTLQ